MGQLEGEARKSLSEEIKTMIEEKIKDAEASTGLWFVTSCGLLLLSQDLKKESEKVSSAGESTGFGGNKSAEVKPISNIAVKRKAEEEDSSSKKMAGEKETAAANWDFLWSRD